MDLMVNPTITKFAQKADGEITELKLGANQEDAYAQIYQKGAESGGGKVENNKTATINVSTYSAPVEITPTSGKTSMKKATVTLSNIPSPGGITKLYCYKDSEDSDMHLPGGDSSTYDFYSTAEITQTGSYLVVYGCTSGGGDTASVQNTTISVTVEDETITFVDVASNSYTLVRDTSKDVTIS